MTLRQAMEAATRQLRTSPDLASTAARDAELLLLHTLALPRTAIYAHADRHLTSHEQLLYTALIDRRLAHEPIQYILGTQEFFGLALRVTPATLIPRPETELLVEAVLSHLPPRQPISLADVGTGSGAIAIALATHLPEARITAIDLSEAALRIARENAQTHGVLDRICFVHADLLADVAPPSHPLDAIVSNPPYIPERDRPTLHPQVREHEPSTALFAGTDGLDIYRRLIPQAALALAPEGLLAMEFGAGQRAGLAYLLAGWRDLRFLDDLQRIPRVALAHRPRTRNLGPWSPTPNALPG